MTKLMRMFTKDALFRPYDLLQNGRWVYLKPKTLFMMAMSTWLNQPNISFILKISFS